MVAADSATDDGVPTAHGNLFERAQTDVFDLESADLGELEALTVRARAYMQACVHAPTRPHGPKVRHDGGGLGSAWKLLRVTVRRAEGGDDWVFLADAWLDDSNRNTLSKLRPANNIETLVVLVRTADKARAGTDSLVTLKVAAITM